LNRPLSRLAWARARPARVAQTRQAEREKVASENAERRHGEMQRQRQAVGRVAALRSETDKLEQLL
jgi:hypothetical protein